MLYIVVTMVVIVAVAGLVVAFVAFPHRGEDLPGAPWLGEAMDRASSAMPTLGERRDERRSEVGAGQTAVLGGVLREERDSRP